MGEVQPMIGDAKGIGVVVAVEPREVVETEESYADEQQGNRFCNRYMSVQVRGHLSIFFVNALFQLFSAFWSYAFGECRLAPSAHICPMGTIRIPLLL